jgi:hypothetical protein
MQQQKDPQRHKNQSRNNGAMVPRAEMLNSCQGKAKASVLYPRNLYIQNKYKMPELTSRTIGQ